MKTETKPQQAQTSLISHESTTLDHAKKYNENRTLSPADKVTHQEIRSLSIKIFRISVFKRNKNKIRRDSSGGRHILTTILIVDFNIFAIVHSVKLNYVEKINVAVVVSTTL